MKNCIHHSGSVIYIECFNAPIPTFVTASIEDLEMIQQHRIRVILDEAITTTFEMGLELKTTLAHLVVNKARSTTIRYNNKNRCDVRRENLSMPFAKTINSGSVRDGVGVLSIKEGMECILDREDLPFAAQYNWSSGKNGKTTAVFTYQQEGKNYKKVLLSRYLMGLTDTAAHTVVHKNGNTLDYTRANLVIKTKSNPTTSENQ